MPLVGLHFCVGFDFVTHSLQFFKVNIIIIIIIIRSRSQYGQFRCYQGTAGSWGSEIEHEEGASRK
jgi:hypothetical protein